jgi:hypothetical protein
VGPPAASRSAAGVSESTARRAREIDFGGALGSLQGVAGLGERAAGTRGPRVPTCWRCVSARILGRRGRDHGAGIGEGRAGVFEFGFEFGEAVRLFETKGGSTWRVGGGHMAVPTPHGRRHG